MEMDRPNRRRSTKVLNRSMYLEIILYFLIAFCGFFSFFYNTPDVILKRPDLDGFNDYFIKIGKFTLIICLNCVMAINYNIMRLSVRSMVFDNKKPSFIVDFCITVLTYIVSNTIVFFVHDASTILGFIGGISTVVISFVCPLVVDIKLNRFAKYHWRNILNYFLLTLICILGIACTAKSVYDFTMNFGTEDDTLCPPKETSRLLL